MTSGLAPDVEALVPMVATALGLWDSLRLEIGEAAVLSGDHRYAGLIALTAIWHGAVPVLQLCTNAAAVPAGVEPISCGDPRDAIRVLSRRLARCPGVAAVDLTGRAESVDVLLASLPRFARLLLTGSAAEPLTIDFYANVHRKGLELRSGLLQPLSSEAPMHQPSGQWSARASRLLLNPKRAADCMAAIGRAGAG
jgi:hypothetical protein